MKSFIDIFQLFIIVGTVNVVFGASMMYKKIDDEKYEPDLIPVSSTVIPLDVFEAINSGTVPHSLPLSEEYKIAYLKHMHKKANEEDDPEQMKKKYYHNDKLKSKRSSTDKTIDIIASPQQAKKISF